MGPYLNQDGRCHARVSGGVGLQPGTPSARPQTHRIATFYAIFRFTSPLRSPSSRPPIASMDRVAAEAGKRPPARSTVQKACKACYTAKVRECLND